MEGEVKFKNDKEKYSQKGFILGDADISKDTDFSYEDDLIAVGNVTIGLIKKEDIYTELGGNI